jgi:hypothetical protein
MWGNVGISHGGVCALAAGIATREIAKADIRKIAVAVAVLFFVIPFSPYF